MDMMLYIFAFMMEEAWFRTALGVVLAMVYAIGAVVMIEEWWKVGLTTYVGGIPRILIPVVLVIMPLFVGANWLITPTKGVE